MKRVNGSGRLLFIISSLRVGGAEKICVQLVNQFYDEGYDVSLLVLNLKEAMLIDKLKAGVNLIDLNVKNARGSIFGIKEVIKKLKPTTCVVFNFQLTVIAVLIRLIYRYRFWLVTRSISTLSAKIAKERNFRHRYFNAYFIKRFYRLADFFIAQSHGMKDDLVSFLKIPAEKIKVIFNPIVLNNEHDCRNTMSCCQKNLLFVGALKEAKNIPFLLDIVAKLKLRRNDFIIRIVGDGPLKGSLLKKANELQIDDVVRFEGFRADVNTYFRKSDLLILTSWYEGFPNVLVEALSFGVPVVSIDCKSGPSDIIMSNVNGYLVNGYNADEFVDRINDALEKKWQVDDINMSIKKFDFVDIYEQYKNCLVNEN